MEQTPAFTHTHTHTAVGYRLYKRHLVGMADLLSTLTSKKKKTPKNAMRPVVKHAHARVDGSFAQMMHHLMSNQLNLVRVNWDDGGKVMVFHLQGRNFPLSLQQRHVT